MSINKKIPSLPDELVPYPVVANIGFGQGPIFDKEGNLFFANYVKDGTIGRMSSNGRVEVWAHTGGQANGLWVDAYKNVVVADVGGDDGRDGNSRLSRIHPVTRQLEVITDNYEGREYGGIYAVCLDSDGTIYFSDPRGSNLENRIGAVYMVKMNSDNDPVNVIKVADGLAYPNGLAFYPGDESRFFVGEVQTRRILEYNRKSDGTLSNGRIVFEFPEIYITFWGRHRQIAMSGFRFDEYNRLWVARWPGSTIDVVDVDNGELLASYEAGGEGVSNVCWWGDSIYATVANRHSIHRMHVGVCGAPTIP